jgi:hypothetical protein
MVSFFSKADLSVNYMRDKSEQMLFGEEKEVNFSARLASAPDPLGCVSRDITRSPLPEEGASAEAASRGDGIAMFSKRSLGYPFELNNG